MADSTYRIELVKGVKGGFLPPPNHATWKNVLESLGNLNGLRNFTENEPSTHDWLGEDTILVVNTPELVWSNAFGGGCTVDPFPEDNPNFVAASDAHKSQFTKVTNAILQAVGKDSQCVANEE
ncbi:hypothetical protein IWQ62_004549 [Dispira parvispora]|uniref:Uncharacterized protein n=1 Tax=Dispira parvispora TaxID=1520584 RepID=A0A9W8ASC8_9FUNG|nr:hypothetical protein IWQ62_004549 [Dispira parvispora]